jgi:hypothetical protein
MKKANSWCTRGPRPERNAEAAVVGGALAFLKAFSDGKPRPWIYGVVSAAASASAMNEHRLAARARANARAGQYAEMTADILNQLLDLPPTPALRPTPPPPDAPFAEQVNNGKAR